MFALFLLFVLVCLLGTVAIACCKDAETWTVYSMHYDRGQLPMLGILGTK